MPPTPYNPHTNPSIYYGSGPKPPTVFAPPAYPPWTPQNTPSGVPGVSKPPSVNYPMPPTTEFSPGANPPRPPSPLYPPGGGGSFAPPAPPRQEGQHGNWFDPTSGVDGDWKDAWGNIIPHANYIPGGGGPGTPPEFGGPTAPAAPPVGGVPGLPMPPQGTPPTFYGPTTGSPYLQLPQNWLAYMSDPDRANLNDRLIGAGFKGTGAYGLNGPSDYVRPAQFDEGDLSKLAVSDTMRQWLRFFLGNLGYGSSYALPGGYVPGSGLPTPPQWPQGGGGAQPPAPIPDPYIP